LGKGIRDGVVQVVDRRSLLDVGVDRGNWLRVSADEFGELFAGLVGAKGMIARKLRFRQKNGVKDGGGCFAILPSFFCPHSTAYKFGITDSP